MSKHVVVKFHKAEDRVNRTEVCIRPTHGNRLEREAREALKQICADIDREEREWYHAQAEGKVA